LILVKRANADLLIPPPYKLSSGESANYGVLKGMLRYILFTSHGLEGDLIRGVG